ADRPDRSAGGGTRAALGRRAGRRKPRHPPAGAEPLAAAGPDRPAGGAGRGAAAPQRGREPSADGLFHPPEHRRAAEGGRARPGRKVGGAPPVGSVSSSPTTSA